MGTRTTLEAARSLAASAVLREVTEAVDSLQSAEFDLRPPTVPHGSVWLQFSLTSGTPDDELVRLGEKLESF
jgi:hypothetical protein